MPSQIIAAPEWSGRIVRLLDQLKITQAGLAERVGVSPATVSRWIQGKHEPTAEGYVALGNLARGPEGAYFWERAGLDLASLAESAPAKTSSSMQITVPAGAADAAQAVAIPLLAITAYGDATPPAQNVRLSEAATEEVLLAPSAWCPHPEEMVALHLAGDSMSPLIAPGSMLVVDTACTDRGLLDRKLVVASHRDLGFKAARLVRVGGCDLLISANHRFAPLDVSNAAKWKIFGEVLWWIARDLQPAA